MLLGSRGGRPTYWFRKQKKKHNSRQWGRTDHCWGTVIARNLDSEADIGGTSRRHEGLKQAILQESLFFKNSIKLAAEIKIVRATTRLQRHNSLKIQCNYGL